MSCQSLENLLAQIDNVIANFRPQSHKYHDSMTKQAAAFRAAARYMNEQTDKARKARR